MGENSGEQDWEMVTSWIKLVSHFFNSIQTITPKCYALHFCFTKIIKSTSNPDFLDTWMLETFLLNTYAFITSMAGITHFVSVDAPLPHQLQFLYGRTLYVISKDYCSSHLLLSQSTWWQNDICLVTR